jgi:hypothetical protein
MESVNYEYRMSLYYRPLGLSYNIILTWKYLPRTSIHKSIDYGSKKHTMTMLIVTLLIMTLLIMTLLLMTVLPL